jgi:hypothetical protein
MENLTKKVKFFKYEIEMFYILKYLQIVLFNIKTIYIVLQI